jgi:histidine phosphotransferase ChpT
MTAIGFGMETLEDGEDDREEIDLAVSMIANGVRSITAKLQFARLAFGAAGSSGREIELGEAEKVARDYIEGDGKYAIDWRSSATSLPKDMVRLLLNLAAIAVSAIPRGGSMEIGVERSGEAAAFNLRMKGEKSRVPDGLEDLLAAAPGVEVDARSIQPYFAGRLAASLGMGVKLSRDGDDIIISAQALAL